MRPVVGFHILLALASTCWKFPNILEKSWMRPSEVSSKFRIPLIRCTLTCVTPLKLSKHLFSVWSRTEE